MKKRGQVWVETVIYTLIALVIIGLFLSFARPKIEEIQDKAIIEQSITMLEDINSKILNLVQGGAGNQRVIELGIKKGTIHIDGANDAILFEIDGRYTFSEPGLNGAPGEWIDVGNVKVRTQELGSLSRVTLISNYSGIYNITY
jgi:type II secretory pathway pseudopilin PulG